MKEFPNIRDYLLIASKRDEKAFNQAIYNVINYVLTEAPPCDATINDIPDMKHVSRFFNGDKPENEEQLQEMLLYGHLYAEDGWVLEKNDLGYLIRNYGHLRTAYYNLLADLIREHPILLMHDWHFVNTFERGEE